MEDAIKIKKTIEYFKINCKRCGKTITGISKKQLKHNLNIHEIFCKIEKKKVDEK